MAVVEVTDLATADWNMPVALPRSAAGNQYVMERITPGKKPASTALSRKRSA
ncbi:hypothetical protein [Streptomyces sp. NPDC056938]|uniref:hypothetical protein n=1 Tax=unclassified Streptomyces TaxID=2593676 RepID=UPI003644D5C3